MQATPPGNGPTLVLEEGAFPHQGFSDFHAHLTALEVADVEVCALLHYYGLHGSAVWMPYPWGRGTHG